MIRLLSARTMAVLVASVASYLLLAATASPCQTLQADELLLIGHRFPDTRFG